MHICVSKLCLQGARKLSSWIMYASYFQGARKLRELIPNQSLWAGETAAANNGGQSGITDTFIDGFWCALTCLRARVCTKCGQSGVSFCDFLVDFHVDFYEFLVCTTEFAPCAPLFQTNVRMHAQIRSCVCVFVCVCVCVSPYERIS